MESAADYYRCRRGSLIFLPGERRACADEARRHCFYRRLLRGAASQLAVLLLLLAHAAFVAALGTSKPLREYNRQAWQSDSGLPQNTVHAVLQTRDGYLWIGTEAGLVRFDGMVFAVFDATNTPALQSGLISSLKEDAAGTLWIGTAAGVVSERAGIFTSYGEKDGLPSAAVLSLYITQSGRLLALTSGGVATFSGRHFHLIAGTEELRLREGAGMIAEDAQGSTWIGGPASIARIDRLTTTISSLVEVHKVGEIQAIAISGGKELWVGGSNGLAVLSGAGDPQLVSADSLPAMNITSLVKRGDGGMWIGTTKGLALSQNGLVRMIPQLASARVQSLFLDRADTLWVATDGGLARVSDQRVDLDPRRLAGVLSIFEDREGSMWFGTDSAGLHMLRDQAFSTLTSEDGLSAKSVRAVFEDHAGTMWIGTSGGGLDRLSAGKIAHFEGALPSPVVLALAETNTAGQHDLWIGTPEGLTRAHGAETKTFTTADGLSDDFIRSAYADRDNSLWVGTRNGLSHYKDGAFHSYSRLDGLASDLVGAILRGHDGTLWVGTLGGLSRMSGESFVPASPTASLPTGAVTALLEDHVNSLWVGINEHGLSRLRKGVITTYSASHLPATIYGMLEDEAGNLWLSSRTGVDRVSLSALDSYTRGGAALPVVHYGSADGMRISEASGGGHPAAWRAKDGGLWFATLDGAAVVHPQAGPHNPVPPVTAIEQVLVDDQASNQTGDEAAIRVAAGYRRLSIQYAGLSFVAPQSVRYRYMLEGFDKEWINAGSRRNAFYTNVPPGSYRFLVRAANGDGVWSLASASQRFVLEPYFYQTGWFYALVALALGGLGYLGYKWRVMTVEAQYQAVLEERSRIAREIHDTLAQGYVAISVQLELAERLMTSSTEAAVQQLRQTKTLVREGLADARSSIWNLRAQSEAETLPSLLAAHAGAASRRFPSGPLIRFTVRGAYRPLARIVEKEVERIAQQALANALAHAHATVITITMTYEQQQLDLRVVDDGVGIDSQRSARSARGHFGMQGMQERAKRIGAILTVDNGPGVGVTITLRLDIAHATAREDER